MLEKWPFLGQNRGLSPSEKCTVARKGHYNFFFLPKLSRDNSNLSRDKLKLSRDKMKSYRAINKKIIAR